MSKRIVIPLSAATGLVAATAVFAAAQAATCAASTTCPTTVQFSVNAGALTINVPDGPLLLGNANAGTTISNSFTGAGGTVVTVSDLRAVINPTWTASVIAGAGGFTTGAGTAAETIDNVNALYLSGNATTLPATGTSTAGQPVPPGTPVTLDVSRTAFSHTGGNGNNITAWDPTISINVPAQAVAGTYSGSINHSVA
ncbi:MAG: hypothetical protein ACRDOO_22430 [Actinomadura sp.]